MARYIGCAFCANTGTHCGLCSRSWGKNKSPLFFMPNNNSNFHVYVNDPITGLTNKEVF